MLKRFFKKEDYLRSTLLILFFLLLFSVLLHEAGHAIICKIEGGSPDIITYNKISCLNSDNSLVQLNLFFGGLFSAITLGIILIILLKFKKYEKSLKIAFITIIIIQIINSLLEGFNFYYKELNNPFFTSILTIITLIAVSIIFNTKK